MKQFKKKSMHLFITVVVLLFNTVLFAQTENIRGVRCKDGSVIYGTIIEMNADKVIILTKDNEAITKKLDDVESFIKETVDTKSEAKSTDKLNYIVLKGGIYSPASNDLKGFGTGYNGDVGLGHYFNQYFASEFGVGYFQSSYSASGSISSGPYSASGSLKIDLWVIPVTLALKAIYPIDKVELYALGGIGAYFANANVDASGSGSIGASTYSGSGSLNSNATAFGGFLGGGCNLNFDQNWYIGLEGKYLWTKPSFSFLGTDISVNMDGWIATGNIGYKF